jgi:hypothetical protein
MNETQTKMAAANLLLERGVRFKIDAPFYIRWLRMNRIFIRPLYAGTIAEFSLVILQQKLEDATEEIAYKNMDAVCRVIAIAMLNDEKKIAKKAEKLAKHLQWRVPAYNLIQIFLYLSHVNSTLDFTIITNYFMDKTNQILKMRNLGQ